MIVFDLDDTLIDTSGAVTPYKLKEFLYFLESQKVILESFSQAYKEIEEIDKKCFTSRDTIAIALKRYAVSHLYDQALALYSEPLPRDFVIPTTPNAKKVLTELKKRQHTLAIVTGGKTAYQMEKLEKAGLEQSLFSKIKVSQDFEKGLHYEALVNEFLVLPKECMAIGDRIPMDLKPANDLGWRTVHMCHGRGRLWKKEMWIESSITDLSELLEIL